MIKAIQLKQVIRNKRFLMFTVFIPVTWYFLLYNLQNTLSPMVMLGIATFIGIIGNSLATFSKRISSNTKFYTFQSAFSRYSIKKFFWDQGVVQLVLNAMIFMVVLVSALLFFHLKVEEQLIIQFILLMIMGLYFSAIGFFMGTKLDSKLIDAVSFPIIIIAALTIVPFQQMGSGHFIDIISKVQMIFPGYYYNNLIQDLMAGQNLGWKDISLFIGTLVLNILPLFLLLPRKNK